MAMGLIQQVFTMHHIQQKQYMNIINFTTNKNLRLSVSLANPVLTCSQM